MKQSSIWESLLAKILMISLSLLLITVQEIPAINNVAVITQITDDNNLKIRDMSQDNAEIGIFKISIDNESIRLTDKGLEFSGKIKLRNSEIVVKYNDEELQNERINEQGERELDFNVCIGRNELSNKPFFFKLVFSSRNPDLTFKKVKLKIEPAIELKLLNQKDLEVNFGRVLWTANERQLRSELSPDIRFSYMILKNTTCSITSANEFCLKHKNLNETISYKLLINGEDTEDKSKADPKVREIQLNALENEFTATFKIELLNASLPAAGEWKDAVTFSIVCDK